MGPWKRIAVSLLLLIAVGGSGPAAPVVTLIAAAKSCTAQCRSDHNQCRIRTKGNRRCDANLRRCLQRCIK